MTAAEHWGRRKMFKKFFKDESGATAIEYGLIAALIVVVVIGGITSVGQSSVLTMANIAENL
jgi:pilus assembly protein Flp/PilA